MGLFNFKLGGSKKEQGKPIRDKLKDKKYFEKILSIKFGEIDDDEKHILEEKKKNVGIVRPFLYWCSAVDYIRAIEISYSMGEDIAKLRKLYINSLDDCEMLRTVNFVQGTHIALILCGNKGCYFL